MFENSLFGAVKLTKNADTEKYSSSEYGTGHNARGCFSLSRGSGFGKNIIIFGADDDDDDDDEMFLWYG